MDPKIVQVLDEEEKQLAVEEGGPTIAEALGKANEIVEKPAPSLPERSAAPKVRAAFKHTVTPQSGQLTPEAAADKRIEDLQKQAETHAAEQPSDQGKMAKVLAGVKSLTPEQKRILATSAISLATQVATQDQNLQMLATIPASIVGGIEAKPVEKVLDASHTKNRAEIAADLNNQRPVSNHEVAQALSYIPSIPADELQQDNNQVSSQNDHVTPQKELLNALAERLREQGVAESAVDILARNEYEKRRQEADLIKDSPGRQIADTAVKVADAGVGIVIGAGVNTALNFASQHVGNNGALQAGVNNGDTITDYAKIVLPTIAQKVNK